MPAEDEGVHPVARHDQHRVAPLRRGRPRPRLEERQLPAVAVRDGVLDGVQAGARQLMVTDLETGCGAPSKAGMWAPRKAAAMQPPTDVPANGGPSTEADVNAAARGEGDPHACRARGAVGLLAAARRRQPPRESARRWPPRDRTPCRRPSCRRACPPASRRACPPASRRACPPASRQAYRPAALRRRPWGVRGTVGGCAAGGLGSLGAGIRRLVGGLVCRLVGGLARRSRRGARRRRCDRRGRVGRGSRARRVRPASLFRAAASQPEEGAHPAEHDHGTDDAEDERRLALRPRDVGGHPHAYAHGGRHRGGEAGRDRGHRLRRRRRRLDHRRESGGGASIGPRGEAAAEVHDIVDAAAASVRWAQALPRSNGSSPPCPRSGRGGERRDGEEHGVLVALADELLGRKVRGGTDGAGASCCAPGAKRSTPPPLPTRRAAAGAAAGVPTEDAASAGVPAAGAGLPIPGANGEGAPSIMIMVPPIPPRGRSAVAAAMGAGAAAATGVPAPGRAAGAPAAAEARQPIRCASARARWRCGSQSAIPSFHT